MENENVPVVAVAPTLKGKDLLESKSFWGIASAALFYFGPKYGLGPNEQSALLSSVQDLAVSGATVFGLLGTYFRVHPITSVFGFRINQTKHG